MEIKLTKNFRLEYDILHKFAENDNLIISNRIFNLEIIRLVFFHKYFS
jgi:hypothetical protein